MRLLSAFQIKRLEAKSHANFNGCIIGIHPIPVLRFLIAEIVKHHDESVTSTIGILPIPQSSKQCIEPSLRFSLIMVPTQAIQHLVLNMDEQPLVKLEVGVGSRTKIMVIHTIGIGLEKALQLVSATNAHFPRIENTVTDLRRQRQIQIIA